MYKMNFYVGVGFRTTRDRRFPNKNRIFADNGSPDVKDAVPYGSDFFIIYHTF